MKKKECTVFDAIKEGMKVGDKLIVPFEFDVEILNDDVVPLFVRNKSHNLKCWLAINQKITFIPQPNHVYRPLDGELCTVLTKEGLATKCKAYHHNGAIYAIALKNDKPHGTFAPEQIAKFLKLC
jgi:hypothetical protein